MSRKTVLDEHGQPRNRAFNAARLSDRALDEFVGLCRMAGADGRISIDEARCLLSWAERNREAASRWPANVLYPRLVAMLQDDTIDDPENAELLDLIRAITGGDVSLEERILSYSTTLPLTRPAPTVDFQGRQFCLTGKFVFGTRRRCENALLAFGGEPQSAPTQRTDYVVIGAIGSTEWIHSSYGRKIEAAIAFRDRGFPISIIAEDHWTTFLQTLLEP